MKIGERKCLDKPVRLLKMRISLTGKSGDDIRPDPRKAKRFPDIQYFFPEFSRFDPPAHAFQDRITSALQRNVKMSANLF